MESWQERVIVEKTELDEKLIRLSKFLISPERHTIHIKDLKLLELQYSHMKNYRWALSERIARFQSVSII